MGKHSRIDRPVAVITGGSQGLGFALSRALLGRGWAVAICARTEKDVMVAHTALTNEGAILARTGDVADDAFQDRFLQDIVQQYGRLDAIVNNASTLGQLPLPRIEDVASGVCEAVFQVNTFAPFRFIQRALPTLRENPRSLIIGISSDAARGGYPTWGVYGASKAAADLLYLTLAHELADEPIDIYTVDPSDMATAMHEAADPGADGLADPADVAEAFMPLFQTVIDPHAERTFQSGTRYQVDGATLREVP